MRLRAKISLILKENSRVIAAIQLKKYMVSVCIPGIIISKLNNKPKLFSVILYPIDKEPKIYFYYIVLSFSLPINLRVKSYRKLLLDVKESSKQKTEIKSKNKVFVTDYWRLEILVFHYYINHNFYKVGYIDSNLNWLVINSFYKTINNDKN